MFTVMLSFKEFISESSKLRQGLPHLHDLKHEHLSELLSSGKLSGVSTRKTDGAAGEVGWDENGFYTRSGRSDKVRNAGDYTNYTVAKKGKEADTTISSSYDEMHDKLKNNPKLTEYLRKRHESGQPSSIKGEFFLGKLGKKTEKGIQFVGTSYNPNAMGKHGMFIMHHQMPENSTHNADHISSLGDSSITFDHDKAENSSFNIDVSKEKEALSKVNPELLKSRKKSDLEAKQSENEKLSQIKSSLQQKLTDHSNSVGKRPWEVEGESEGDVFHVNQSSRFKVTSPEFKQFKQNQKSVSNA